MEFFILLLLALFSDLLMLGTRGLPYLIVAFFSNNAEEMKQITIGSLDIDMSFNHGLPFFDHGTHFAMDAMVMDEKVKEGFVLDSASAICKYDAYYKDHPKYWCRGYFRDYCNIIAFTPNSTERVTMRDTGNQLIVTMSCLTKEDTGWYWCGIQRDFARDHMDFTELIVTDKRGDFTDNFWSGKGNKNRSCRTSKVVHKADRSRFGNHLYHQSFVQKEEKSEE
ncbi:CMRF35-like molecule 5 [Tupaia chinensis]|uniref:CMRF35-like molecule 5 n=1 Tax=Tupaia chinensis TaxID=246437 RepID=L9KQM4_TUPCH|nr:CMRF35-like molecule 5 [Tupaia chinensis]